MSSCLFWKQFLLSFLNSDITSELCVFLFELDIDDARPPPLPLLDFPLYCQFFPPSFFCLLNINSRTRNSPFFPFLPFLSKSNFKILEIPCYLILKCLFKLFKVQSMHYRFEFLVLFKHNRKQSFMNMSKVKYELILP